MIRYKISPNLDEISSDFSISSYDGERRLLGGGGGGYRSSQLELNFEVKTDKPTSQNRFLDADCHKSWIGQFSGQLDLSRLVGWFSE